MTNIRSLKDTNGNVFYPRTHVQAVNGLTLASEATDGLMAAADKRKLDLVIVDSNGNVIVNIPLATAQNDGLMSKEDFAKLGRILFSGSSTIDLQTVLQTLQEHDNRIAALESGGGA